jgi:membrane fusion protein, multidrug efflux system
MKKSILYIILTLGLMLALSACGKKQDDAKSMDQIQDEMGIPVRVEQVEPQTFEQILRYNATLGGIEESVAQAMVSDVVTKINAKVGDRVKKGDIIISFPPNTPAAQYEQAKTAFSSISAIHDRMRRLQEQGAISLQDYENVQTQYNIAKANLESSEQLINVRAPINGIITDIMVSPAQRVHPGMELFKLISADGYKASIMIPETEIGMVKLGKKVTATWDSQTLSGKISTIAMAMDPNTKAFRVEATFPGFRKDVNYGVTAEIGIQILSKANVFLVQRHHILREDGKSYVYKAVDGKAVRTEIVTGLDNQMQYEVLSGLDSGDQLITQGLKSLSDGIKIRIIEGS